MKFEVPKEWFIRSAKIEGDSEVGAGHSPFLQQREEAIASPVELAIEMRLAFGRFVELMRRNLKLSVEQLSAKADVDLAELVSIENGISSVPEPVTVYQLATFFRVPEKRLMQLAGLAQPKDAKFLHEAVRFAARSEPVEKLTADQHEALEHLIAVLNEEG